MNFCGRVSKISSLKPRRLGRRRFSECCSFKIPTKKMLFDQKQNIFNRSFKSPFFQKMVISHRSTRRKWEINLAMNDYCQNWIQIIYYKSVSYTWYFLNWKWYNKYVENEFWKIDICKIDLVLTGRPLHHLRLVRHLLRGRQDVSAHEAEVPLGSENQLWSSPGTVQRRKLIFSIEKLFFPNCTLL